MTDMQIIQHNPNIYEGDTTPLPAVVEVGLEVVVSSKEGDGGPWGFDRHPGVVEEVGAGTSGEDLILNLGEILEGHPEARLAILPKYVLAQADERLMSAIYGEKPAPSGV